MQRFVLILLLYFYSLGSYGQFFVGLSKSTHFSNRPTENILSNSYSNTIICLSEEENSDDVIGNIPVYNELSNATNKSTCTFLSDFSTAFVKKQLLLYRLDLPPPISF